MRDLNHLFINVLPSDSGGGVFGPAPGFGPVPDGTFIPDAPLALFQQGKFHKELRSLVVGNVANEVSGWNPSHVQCQPSNRCVGPGFGPRYGTP